MKTTSLVKLPQVLPEVSVPGWVGVELAPVKRQVAVLEAERNPHMLVHLEQEMADLLINEVNTKLQVGAKPFCIYPGARPSVPFYVHKDGSLGWHMEPADWAADLIPEEALFILLLVGRARFPVTDIRVGREVYTLPPARKSFDDILMESVQSIRATAKKGYRQLSKVGREAMGALEAFFMPDPVLVVRVGRVGGFWVELYRWNL